MLKRLKLTTKLLGSFLVILTITAVVGVIGYRAMMGVADRSDKAVGVGTIVQLLQETRQQEKNYMLRKDEESLKKQAEAIAKLFEQVKTTSAKFTQQVNKDQMTEVDTDAKAYQTAFQGYVDLSKQREAQMEKMRASARAIPAEVEKMAASQKMKLAKILAEASGKSTQNQGELEKMISDRVAKINDAAQILILLVDARKNEKEFIISNGQKEWREKVDVNIKTIQELATGLKSRSTQQENIDQAEAIIAGIASYDKYFDDYAALMTKQKEAETKMIEVAREAQKTCLAAMTDQKAKMQSEISSAVTLLITTCISSFLIGLFLAITITRGITGPVIRAANHVGTMAGGDFTTQLDITHKDEIGMMGTSLNAMSGQLGAMIREIVGGVNSLTTSSTEMAAISQQLSNSARDTAHKSGSVATAAEEMSTNFQSVSAAMEQAAINISMVASAAEEMTATVNEISKNAENARGTSESAVVQSQLTSERMTALGKAAQKIGKVTETISEISAQTNLLALNATIEASRAGEAGKGFAVVANEIKELARQTAAATVEITSQIDDMQSSTAMSIDDIEKITEVIAAINIAINGIASAVVEQSAATSEISSNIAQASQGITEVNESVAQSSIVVGDVTRDIAQINQQSSQVGDGSNQVQLNAQSLSVLADQLGGMVKRFKVCPA
jgi:methyl-accepting chemotaxis protein